MFYSFFNPLLNVFDCSANSSWINEVQTNKVLAHNHLSDGNIHRSQVILVLKFYYTYSDESYLVTVLGNIRLFDLLIASASQTS